jgi:hypothetical protein
MTRIEITPTYRDHFAYYAEHDGATNTSHRMRWLYADATPATDWAPCTDCEDNS